MILRLGDTYYIGALFLDANGDGVDGLSPVVHARHGGLGTWWNGSALAATPTNLAMIEVDATNAPGEYIYAFTPNVAGQYFLTCFEAAGGSGSYGGVVVGPVQPSEVLFGLKWVEDIGRTVLQANIELETPSVDVDVETPLVAIDVELELIAEA